MGSTIEAATHATWNVEPSLRASVALRREAQKERRSASTDGIDLALQSYQAAYRALDLDALLAVYPRLPADRQRYFRKLRSACAAYDVTLSVGRRSPGAADTVIVEAQASYQCTLKASSQSQTFQMSEAFWLRKDANGAWIIDNISTPLPGR